MYTCQENTLLSDNEMSRIYIHHQLTETMLTLCIIFVITLFNIMISNTKL